MLAKYSRELPPWFDVFSMDEMGAGVAIAMPSEKPSNMSGLGMRILNYFPKIQRCFHD
jgi:hypothetical protein